MDQDTPPAPGTADPAAPAAGSTTEPTDAPQTEEPTSALPEEAVRWLTDELGLPPETVAWLQELVADAPLENIDVTGIAALWAASAGAGLLATLLALVVPLLIYVFTYAVVAGVLALLIWIPHRAVPSRHRRIYGFSIFLTIIPVFGVLWNFRVASRVPDSFRSYFDAHPDAAAPPPGAVGGATVNVGTAGKSLGLWYAGLTLGSWLAPWTCVLAFLLFPLGLAALVLYILFIVKLFALAGAVNEHKRRPRQATPALAPPPASIPTTPPPSTAPATPPATPPAAS